MSLYAVHSICRDALADESFQTRLNENPEAALADRNLTPEEREALLAGDVARLYSWGAHEYVLTWLARAEVLGLNVPGFMQRITQAEPRYIY
jgi:hypothetical protein